MNSPRRDFTVYLILPCAILMQACLGATYSWPGFVKSLRDSTGLGQGAVQLPFTVFYIVFPATVLFAGTVLAKLGPRWSSVLGSIIFGGGWITASLGDRSFAFTVAGIGVLGGLGVGLAYLAPITSLMLWFPRHKGLVTGLVVGGFGAGAAAVSQAADYLMKTRGETPYQVFATLGFAYMLVAGLAGLALKRPPAATSAPDSTTSPIETTQPPRFKEVTRERAFQILYFAMFCGLAAGFIVLANLKQLGGGAVTKSGAAAISIFALFNALGRIGWGAGFDRLQSPRRVLQANLAAQALLLLAAPWLLAWGGGLLATAALAGLNYGGMLVLYASSVAFRWGAPRVGHVYGWLFSANIFASVAPVLAGCAYDQWHSFTVPLLTVAILLCAAVVLLQGLPGERHEDGSAVGSDTVRELARD